MNVAAAERVRKAARPGDYCASRDCLWNEARSGPCARHAPMAVLVARQRVADVQGYTMAGAPTPMLRERLAQQPVDVPVSRRPW